MRTHRRPLALSDRRRRQLARDSAACSTTPRWVRGGIGFLLGGLLGSMLGGGIAFAIAMPSDPSTVGPSGMFRGMRTGVLLATGITVAGAAGGLYFGAAKPDC